jgi:outer membrane protein assembly factor BamB
LAACSGGTPAGGWSSATVANGVVYFGGTNGKLYALDANTGSLKWPAYAGETGKPLLSIYGTPAVDNGVVYFGASDGYVYALDAASGAKKWIFDANAESVDKRGIVPSLLVADGVVYFGANDHYFYAVDAGTGAQKWRFLTSDKIWGDATFSNQTIYFGSFDHHLYALNLDGTKKWDYDAGGLIISKPLVANGLVYFGALEKLFALDASTGTIKPQHGWEQSLEPNHWIWSNPTMQDDMIYVSDLAEQGQVHAFDALSGSPKWAQPFEAGGQVHSSVAISDTVGYFGTASNKVFALDAKSGSPVWKQPFPAEGPVYATPTVAGDSIYVNSHGRAFYALLAADGQPKWCFDVTQDKPLTPCVAAQAAP